MDPKGSSQNPEIPESLHSVVILLGVASIVPKLYSKIVGSLELVGLMVQCEPNCTGDSDILGLL